MIQYLLIEFLHMISHFTLNQGTKEFLLKLPVGFWTLASGLVTAGVAVLTLVVTQMMNLKTQERQAKTHNESLITQLNHQRELAYRQHFLDKRTEALLEFQKELEACLEILESVYSDTADMDRRKKLKVRYKQPMQRPLRKEDIEGGFNYEDIQATADLALQQFSSIGERSVALKKASNLFLIYLDPMEVQPVKKAVLSIHGTQDYMLSILRTIKELNNVHDSNILVFIHMSQDKLSGNALRAIQKECSLVRKIFAKYLYIDKLDA